MELKDYERGYWDIADFAISEFGDFVKGEQ